MPGGCSGGDISEWEIPCPELMRLSCPGRIDWSLPRLSRCTISPSTSQVTVCRPGCGCGRDLHAGASADVLGAEVVDEAPGVDHPALSLRQQPADGRIAPQ